MYNINSNPNIVLYDIDDTLVMIEPSESNKNDGITLKNGIYTEVVYPNHGEIDSLKKAKIRGHYVRVASQGGHEWAELVIKALGLENYVDSIETKPKWYHDDLPADNWMKRFWHDPASGKK